MSARSALILRISRGRGAWRVVRSLAARAKVPLVAPALAEGTDAGILEYYGTRITDADFLADRQHPERPRADWILGQVSGGSVLEIGSGNGGLTAMLARQVEDVVALDASAPSVHACAAKSLPNVTPVHGIIERYEPATKFDWVVASEVVEHLRDPGAVLRQCVQLCRPGGVILLTTPLGHWPSIEHLHEFTSGGWASLLASSGGRRTTSEIIPDRQGVPRWLGGRIEVG